MSIADNGHGKDAEAVCFLSNKKFLILECAGLP